MLYKEYGKTGKMVSAIGCGGMRFNEEMCIRDRDNVYDAVKDMI